MHVDRRALDQGLVSFLGIFAGCVPEKASTHCLAHFGRVSSTRDNPVVVSVHDTKQLLANILGAPDLTGLYEVFETPRVVELGVLPPIVYIQQGQVVTVGIVEFGLLLVRLLLLLLGSIEDGLNG